VGLVASLYGPKVTSPQKVENVVHFHFFLFEIGLDVEKFSIENLS
jgi:hypothetical protein